MRWNQMGNRVATSTFATAVRLGLIGGLAATIAMDIVMVGMFLAMAMPTGVFFSFIGEAASTFLSIIGFTLDAGVLLGAILHYLIGPMLGLFFTVVVYRYDFCLASARWKLVLLSIVYTETASILLLVPAAIILKMAAPDAIRLFSMALFLHAVWGSVLGLIVNRKLKSSN
jgi:hypothetical protein